ncbi:MAG: type II secretion system inner membrane protein GspF [Candidatus Binatia bacterium]
MPVYSYAGLDPNGKSVSGIIDAESPRAARLKLRRTGVFPTNVAETKETESTRRASRSVRSYFERVGPQELSVMTRQLSTLVSAGLPLVDCLTALIDQVDSKRLKSMLTQTRERVNEGSSLADALAEHPRTFSELYINMVRAGEASGALDVVLMRLADYTESSARLRSKLRAALTYPAIMVIVGSGILFFLLSYVVPKITRIFVESKQVLPLPTRVLIGTSGLLAQWWPLLLMLLVAAAIGFRYYIRTPGGRYSYDRWVLRSPVFGKLLQKIAVARFSRTLSTLLKSGIGLLPSLDIVKNIVDNRVLYEATEAARDAIREGQSIAPPLKKSGIFPPLMIHMIAVGEKSGQLEEMLFKTAETYEGEVDTSIATLTTLLEPVMIVFMGGVVTFIVLSILLPIFQMSQLVR